MTPTETAVEILLIPPDGEYGCRDFDAQNQLQRVLERIGGDPHRFDGDSDGGLQVAARLSYCRAVTVSSRNVQQKATQQAGRSWRWNRERCAGIGSTFFLRL